MASYPRFVSVTPLDGSDLVRGTAHAGACALTDRPIRSWSEDVAEKKSATQGRVVVREDSESGSRAQGEPGPLLAPLEHAPEHRAEHRASPHVLRRPRGRLHARMHRNPATALATKIGVTIVGSVVLLAGVIMLVTPGPGLVGIAVGLAILATEYDWAARWLQVARRRLAEAKRQAEEMDPAVRRRRIMLIGGVLVVVACFGVWYVATFDWPRIAVDGWDWAQNIAGWLPDLPGM